MSNEILYIVNKSSRNLNVVNSEDYDVTISYNKLKFYQYTFKDLFNLIKYNYLFGIKLKYFLSHDQKCLGVDKNTLLSWRIKVFAIKK